MRSTRNHLIRAFTVLAAVLVFGAGIAVAAESTIPSDDSEPSDVVEVLADETHGSVVSAAAQDHREDDDECGDHGAYVSSVAEGLEDCEPVDEAVEDEEEVAEKGEEVAKKEEGDEGPPEDSHGSVVSAAAQDHSYDDECGNHGAHVSSVARGLEDCEVPPGLEDPVDTEGDDEDDEVETAGPPDHVPGPPADAGPSAGAGPNR